MKGDMPGWPISLLFFGQGERQGGGHYCPIVRLVRSERANSADPFPPLPPRPSQPSPSPLPPRPVIPPAITGLDDLFEHVQPPSRPVRHPGDCKVLAKKM